MPSRGNITTVSGKKVKEAATVSLDQAASETHSTLDQGVVLLTQDGNHVEKQRALTSHRLAPEEVTLFVPGRCINPVLIEDQSDN
jgi:hypothetical protein